MRTKRVSKRRCKSSQGGEITLTVSLKLTAGWQEAQGPSYVGVETHSPPGTDKR